MRTFAARKQSPMKLVTVGTVAFDNIETPFGRADKVVGGAATYISLAASFFLEEQGIVSVVGEDFPTDMMAKMKAKGIAEPQPLGPPSDVGAPTLGGK